MAAGGCQNVALPPAWRARADELRVRIQATSPDRGMPSRRGLLLMALRRGLYRLESGLQEVSVIEAPYSDRFSLLASPLLLQRANRLRVQVGLMAGNGEILSRRVVVLTALHLGLSEIERAYPNHAEPDTRSSTHDPIA